jgi:hypothetical protein
MTRKQWKKSVWPEVMREESEESSNSSSSSSSSRQIIKEEVPNKQKGQFSKKKCQTNKKANSQTTHLSFLCTHTHTHPNRKPTSYARLPTHSALWN